MVVYILALLKSFLGWQKLQQQQQQHNPANMSNNIRSRVLLLSSLLLVMEKDVLICHAKSG